ncbi:MAG: carboxypeptidase regulatory-like domain-containing protein [Acidobacteria bacterium]|nr:carboxypeptidase regulatory-like domain-containing protein [Acidobacteriota bacterium]
MFAQSDSTSINGTITDPSGAAIANAKVTARNQNTTASREALTSGSGTFVIPSLPSGVYTLIVEVSGFKKFESKNNKIDANLPATIDAVMQVGTTTETIEVQGTVSAIQTESSTLGKLVDGKQLSDLQLNGRNPIFLALLKPGVRGGSLAGFSFDLTSGGFNINGSRSQDNLITFDGAVGIRTRSNGTSIGTADLDSVQEVQILTANYSAEYGRAGGGQIRVVTKTGGQQFHGGIFENFRNSALNANTWTNRRNGVLIPAEKFNQFGFNVNGPIFIPGKWNTDKSKAFFYFGQEWARRREVSTGLRTVPTSKMRTGDFSELLSSNIFFAGQRVIRDPSGTPYPNNTIPGGQTSPNGLAMMKVFPDANLASPQGSSNWYGLQGAPTNQRKDTYGLDIIPTGKDSVKFRMSLFNYYNENPFQTNFLISARTFDRPNQTASLNWTRIINPTTVHETLLTASRDQVFIRMQETTAFDRTKYGINYAYIFPDGKDRPNKLPEFDAQNFSTYTGSPYPSSSTGPIYNISNNTTKTAGTHTIKFGVMFERAGQNDYDQINISGVPGGTTNQNGGFQFRDSRVGGTGVALADAAAGLFNSYAEIGKRAFTPYRGHMLEFFAQDSWKVTDKLKLEFGARYSLIQPYYSLWRNMSVFDPAAYDKSKAVRVDPVTGNPLPGGGDPYNGVIIPGDGWTDGAKGRVPLADSGELNRLFRGDKSFSQMQKNLIQPRVGLAYSITPKTVIRTGIGRFSTRLGVSDSIFLGGNAPFQPLASIPTGRVDNPGGGSRSGFPLSVNTQDPIFKNPESWNWNATVETQLPGKNILEISYVGRKGLHAQRERNLNQLAPGTLQANPGVNANYLRPYAGFGPIRITNNEASSYYRAFQLGLNRRFSNGLSYGFAYTLAKSNDNGSGQRDVLPNAWDATNLWAPSDFDTRQVAVINFIYELPFLKNQNTMAGKIAGGWQISGVTQFQTGTPGTIATGDDFAGVGTGSGSQIWNLSGPITYDRNFAISTGASSYWFNPGVTNGAQTLATRPAQGTFTSQFNRNLSYGPGFQNWNISMFKTFRIAERAAVQFRADAFNYINHPNWSGVDRNPTSATFGKVTGKQDQRNMQLGLRVNF